MAESHDICQIPELVEHIILHLPLQDILRAQAVSKIFRNIITSSPTIHRALFREPLTKPTEKQLALLADSSPTHMIRRGQLAFPGVPGVPYDFFVENTPARLVQVALLNPLFNRFVDYLIACQNVKTGTDVNIYRRQSISLRRGAFPLLDATPPTASWRNMLLIQPQAAPVYEMAMHQTPGQGGIQPHHNRTIPVYHAGLSMREFLAKEEVHQWRRELSSPEGRYFIFANCTLGLRTDTSWQLGLERVEEIKDERGFGVMVRPKGDATGWDVIRAAEALEAEERKLEELDGSENDAE